MPNVRTLIVEKGMINMNRLLETKSYQRYDIDNDELVERFRFHQVSKLKKLRNSK